MTDEEMMAGHMTDEQMMAAPKKKGGRYKQNQTLSPEEQERRARRETASLSFGLASEDTPGRDQAMGKDSLGTEPELSPVEKQLRDAEGPYAGDVRFLKEAAPLALGLGAGAGARFLLGRAATGASPALERGSQAAAEWAGNAISHGNLHGLPLTVLRAMFPSIVNAMPMAGAAAAGVGASVAPAAGLAGGSLIGSAGPSGPGMLLGRGVLPPRPNFDR